MASSPPRRRRCARRRVRQRWRWIVVLSLWRPGTTEKTARERARPAHESVEQSTVSRERAEVREVEEVNTPLMSINTAKLVRWLQEHLQIE